MIFYFSGTGNSYSAAKQIADNIEGEQLLPIAGFTDFAKCEKEERIGIAFPCYMGDAPKAVLEFKKELFHKVDTSSIYTFVIITYNHSDAATYLGFKEDVDAWFRVRMPQSDIYNSKAATKKVKDRLLEEAGEKLTSFSKDILLKKHTIMYKKVPGLATIAKIANQTLMYKDTGSKLYADNKCTKCKLCMKVCPMGNISFDKEPKWGARCESCFGCINRCPQEAIQFGKKTRDKERYINPDFVDVFYR